MCANREWRTLLKSVKGEGKNLLKEIHEILTGGLKEKKKNVEEVRKVLLVLGNKPTQYHIVSPQVNPQNKGAICS